MVPTLLITFCAITAASAQSFDGPAVDWVDRDESGAYQFGYATGDEGRHYHVASATANNMVNGRFGYKDPETGKDLQTVYTAGRKGFRARGPHIARRMDLSQNRPPFARPNKDGKYIPELDNIFDPNEDRGYDFSLRTPTHVRDEHADRVGDVQGRYSYVDDVGNRHSVNYIAGSRTGFVVTNAVPDTFARARGGPLYFVGKRPGPKIRGFHAIQKALDGSYRFEASGPDHKRSEISDSNGNRRGIYTYLDDKGVQHTVEYIAGPKIGYKVINNRKGTSYKPVLPLFPDAPTLGSFSPSFPTSTLRPIGSSPSFTGGGSGSTSSPSSGFPLKPTEPTRFPIRPLPGSASKFPTALGFSGDPSDTATKSPDKTPDPSFAFPGSTSPSPVSSIPSHSSGPSSTISTKLPDSTSPSSLFPSSSVSDSASADNDQKWDYGLDHGGLKNPHFPLSKDWSKHTKPDAEKKSRPTAPSRFPFFKTPSSPEPGPLHTTLLDEGDSDSRSELKPPSIGDCRTVVTSTKDTGGHSPSTRTSIPHYRGSIKFGGIRRSHDDKEKREDFLEIPPGLAVRAHVQSLDIVPFNKRFASPGEALAAFNKSRREN